MKNKPKRLPEVAQTLPHQSHTHTGDEAGLRVDRSHAVEHKAVGVVEVEFTAGVTRELSADVGHSITAQTELFRHILDCSPRLHNT